MSGGFCRLIDSFVGRLNQESQVSEVAFHYLLACARDYDHRVCSCNFVMSHVYNSVFYITQIENAREGPSTAAPDINPERRQRAP